jgi:hypothetical protein
MPHTPASPIARSHVALDPACVVRPGAAPDRDQPDIVRDWLAHLEAGRLIHAPRPPADRDA